MALVSTCESYMALLQDYSTKTGVPIDRCVSDALFDWLANIAPVTLEQMGLKPLKLCSRQAAERRIEDVIRASTPRSSHFPEAASP
jgi:hypothetical protein